jgi:two-component system CheB/CheR fusion protein
MKKKQSKGATVAPKAIETQETAGIETQETAGIDAASFPIVGIGASAGGLAAFEAFFSCMPADIYPGM